MGTTRWSATRAWTHCGAPVLELAADRLDDRGQRPLPARVGADGDPAGVRVTPNVFRRLRRARIVCRRAIIALGAESHWCCPRSARAMARASVAQAILR